GHLHVALADAIEDRDVAIAHGLTRRLTADDGDVAVLVGPIEVELRVEARRSEVSGKRQSSRLWRSGIIVLIGDGSAAHGVKPDAAGVADVDVVSESNERRVQKELQRRVDHLEIKGAFAGCDRVRVSAERCDAATIVQDNARA